MRQWELFGITDSDLHWTPPPRPPEPDEIIDVVEVVDLSADPDDDLVPDPAA